MQLLTRKLSRKRNSPEIVQERRRITVQCEQLAHTYTLTCIYHTHTHINTHTHTYTHTNTHTYTQTHTCNPSQHSTGLDDI